MLKVIIVLATCVSEKFIEIPLSLSKYGEELRKHKNEKTLQNHLT